jgi:competence protein ComEC
MAILTSSPVLWATLGAALSYYSSAAILLRDSFGLPGLLCFLFLLIIPVSLYRSGTFIDPPPGGSSRIYALILGLLLGTGARWNAADPVRLGLPAETVTGIRGILTEDPRESRDGRGMGYLTLEAARSPGTGAGEIRGSAGGRVLVFFPEGTLPRLKEFGRGSAVYAEGVFAKGTPFFRARAVYILKPAPAHEQLRTGIRIALLDKLALYSWGGLASALLLGVRDTLDGDLAEAYQKAGCPHVLALSGMHLAIVSATAAFFLKRPLGFRGAAITGAVFIVLYVLLVGAQPSLIRSAIMYLLGTGALLGTLPRRPLDLLSMSFLVQLIISPGSGDTLSFILSYLALAGILVVGEHIQTVLRGRLPAFLSGPLAASLGAFIATSAVTAASFGILRPVGIPAGLVIVPLTSVFMVGAMAVLALNFFTPFAARPLGFVLGLIYYVLDRLVSLAALVPGIPAFGRRAGIALSLGIAVLCVILGKRYVQSRNRLAPFT